MPHLSFAALANPRRGNAWLVACVLLAVSVIAIEFINPNLLPHPKAAPAYRPYGDGGRRALAHQDLADTRVYAAEVVRIIAATPSWRACARGPAARSKRECGCAASMRQSCMPAAARSYAWRSPHVRRCNGCSPRAASCCLTSGRTNILDASMPMLQPTAPTISRRRCFQAASHALMPAGGVGVGAEADDGGRTTEDGSQSPRRALIRRLSFVVCRLFI